MDEAQKEKFKKQLESYKKDLGFNNKDIKKSSSLKLGIENVFEKKPFKSNNSIDFKKELSTIKQKSAKKIEQKKDLITTKSKEISIKTEVVKEKIIEKVVETRAEIKKEDTAVQPEKMEKVEVKKKEKKEVFIKSEDVEEEKKSKLSFILAPLLLLIVVGLAYSFYSNHSHETEKEVGTEISGKEIFVQDSILAYEDLLLEIEVTNTVSMSDTIFNIKSDKPEGYYVVVGAYGKLKNAKKLQKGNPTTFESYIFDGKMKRVALLVGNDDNKSIESLETIRFKYPDAWVMYNTTE
jgi:hypothetical protein